MSQEEIQLIGADGELDLADLCRVVGMEREVVIEWVAEGVIEPRGEEHWRFSARQLRRMQVACRLHRDLELDPRALPTVLDLLEEVERLRREVRVLRRLRD